jgi:limonene-1,2-epoxide hydrolase
MIRKHAATLESLFDCWTRFDLDGALELMAENVVFEPDLKGTRHDGVEALRTLWGKYRTVMTSYDCRIVAVLESDDMAMLERKEVAVTAAGALHLPIMAVFRFDPAGKITHWRDYWDSSMVPSH